MAFKQGWKLCVFLICFYSARLFFCFQITTYRFHVLKRNKAIRQCTGSILEKTENVGYRVSDETGKCEALQKAWLHNQTIESGYGYAKKIFQSMMFKEPLVEYSHLQQWAIPGVLVNGSQIDVFISNPNIENRKPTEAFRMVITGKSNRIVLISYQSGTQFRALDADPRNEYPRIEMPPVCFTKDIVKLSIVFQTEFAKLAVNDREIWTLPISNYVLDFHSFNFEGRLDNAKTNTVIVHGFQIRFA